MKNKILTPLFAGLALSLVFSTAQAIPLPIDPTIRFAGSRIVVLRKEMSVDTSTGKVSTKTTVLCDANLKVPVWADVSGDYNYVPAKLDCDTEWAGQKITLTSQAALKFSTAQIFPNSPPEKFKEARSSYMFSNPNVLPALADQVVITRDLHQKSFVIQAAPSQYVTCASPAASSCTVTNPVVLQVTWDILDTE